MWMCVPHCPAAASAFTARAAKSVNTVPSSRAKVGFLTLLCLSFEISNFKSEILFLPLPGAAFLPIGRTLLLAPCSATRNLSRYNREGGTVWCTMVYFAATCCILAASWLKPKNQSVKAFRSPRVSQGACAPLRKTKRRAQIASLWTSSRPVCNPRKQKKSFSLRSLESYQKRKIRGNGNDSRKNLPG